MPRLFKAAQTLRDATRILGILGASTMVGFEVSAASYPKLEAERKPQTSTVTDRLTTMRDHDKKLRHLYKPITDSAMKTILKFDDLTEFAGKFVVIDSGRDNGGKKDRAETGDVYFAFLRPFVGEYRGYQQQSIRKETLTVRGEVSCETIFDDEPRRIPDDVLLARRARRELSSSLPLYEPMKPERIPDKMRLATREELIALKKLIVEDDVRLHTTEIFTPGFTLEKLNEALSHLSTEEFELSSAKSPAAQLR